MLKAIFGTETRAKILLFLYSNRESYPTEIAKALGLYLNTVQNQLLNMERDGLLYSRARGKVRLFGINPRYPFKKIWRHYWRRQSLFSLKRRREFIFAACGLAEQERLSD